MLIAYRRRPRASSHSPIYLLDLDNTLHYASRFILPEINRQMTRYLQDALCLDAAQASQVRRNYWLKYGATLLGMMRHHGTNPHHFLHHTHQFSDLKSVASRPSSVPARLHRLHGLRILLTNAPGRYAADVLKVLRLDRHIDAVLSIEDMVIHQRWRPKPSNWLWPALRRQFKARKMVLVDDTREHLHACARHGIEPVWITKPGLGFGPVQRKGRVKHRIRNFNELNRIGHPSRRPGKTDLSEFSCE